MQSAFISFAAMVVLACIVFVIGHQLSLNGFDPDRYEVLRGVLPLAYVVVALALGVTVVGIVAAVFKK